MEYHFLWRILVYLSRMSSFVGCDATSGTSSSPSDSMKEPGGQNGIPTSLFSTAFYFDVFLFIPPLILTHISPPPCVFKSPEHATHNHNSSTSWILHFQPPFTWLHSKEITYLSFACSSSEVTRTDSFLVYVQPQTETDQKVGASPPTDTCWLITDQLFASAWHKSVVNSEWLHNSRAHSAVLEVLGSRACIDHTMLRFAYAMLFTILININIVIKNPASWLNDEHVYSLFRGSQV